MGYIIETTEGDREILVRPQIGTPFAFSHPCSPDGVRHVGVDELCPECGRDFCYFCCSHNNNDIFYPRNQCPSCGYSDRTPEWQILESRYKHNRQSQPLPLCSKTLNPNLSDRVLEYDYSTEGLWRFTIKDRTRDKRRNLDIPLYTVGCSGPEQYMYLEVDICPSENEGWDISSSVFGDFFDDWDDDIYAEFSTIIKTIAFRVFEEFFEGREAEYRVSQRGKIMAQINAQPFNDTKRHYRINAYGIDETITRSGGKD